MHGDSMTKGMCRYFLILVLAMLTACVNYKSCVETKGCIDLSARAGRSGVLVVKVANISNDYLAILEQDSLFDLGDGGTLGGDMLKVSNARSEPLAYKGMMVTYMAVNRSAVLKLAPGESRQFEIPLEKNYEVGSEAVLKVTVFAKWLRLMRFANEKKMERWLERVSRVEDFRLEADFFFPEIVVRMDGV